MTKIKICGLTRREDIFAVNALRPDYIGFVFAKSRRQVQMEQAQRLKKELHASIQAVGVFVHADPETEAELFRQGIIDMVQLHGQEGEGHIKRLKELTRTSCRGEVPVIKVVSMDGMGAVEPWQESMADYLLLDNGPGGTGEAFDHSLLLSGKINKPFFLAGGVSPENAPELIEHYHPFALDVSSKVETDGWKDKEKIRKMIQAVRGRGNMPPLALPKEKFEENR